MFRRSHSTGPAICTAIHFALEQLEARRLLSAPDLILATTFPVAPGQAVKFGNESLFCTYDRTAGQMLWASDGTSAGTRLIKDIDAAVSTPSTWFVSGRDNALVIGDTFYFTAVDNAHGRELWKSNGTAEGTMLVRDIVPGQDDSEPEGFVELSGELYFTANHKIWKSDGTEAGTSQLSSIDPIGFVDGERMAVLHNELYFTNYPSSANYFSSSNTGQLRKLQSTIVADTNGDSDFVYPTNRPFGLINVNNTLYFTAADSTHGYELWKSDGTLLGTKMVADLSPGAASSSPSDLVNFQGSLWFAAAGSLWKSDGTVEGTVRISNLTNPTQLIATNATLYFTSDTSQYGRELWRTDGTIAGTKLLKDIRQAGDSNPDRFLDVRGHFFFRADDGVHGSELWHTDGTTVGTTMIADFAPDGSSVPIPFGVASTRILVAARADGALWNVYSLEVPIPSRPPMPKLKADFDTGISDSDHVTRATRPIFTGVAMPDSIVRLFDDGVEIGSAFPERGQYFITPTEPLRPGKHTLTVTAADDDGRASPASDAVSVKIDRTLPEVRLLQASPTSVVLKFTENVHATLSTADLQIQNLKTGQILTRSQMKLTYDDPTNTANITFPQFEDHSLSAGRHAITVIGKGISDVAGNRIERKPTFEFNVAVAAGPRPLPIYGTDGNDEIIVRLKSGDAATLQVLVNGQLTERERRRISSLRIDAQGGDDLIQFDHQNGAVRVASRIYGGDGNDIIDASSGNDRIYGGSGDDNINGGSGNDIIYGGEGMDRLAGGPGHDYLVGGSGADILTGNRGHDRIFRSSDDQVNFDELDQILNDQTA